MIEEDATTGEQPVGLAVIGDLPVGGGLGDCIGAAGAEGGVLGSRHPTGVAKTFAGAGVVEPDGTIQEADGLQEIEGTGRDALQGFHGLLKREADGGLAGQVVDLVRRYPGQRLQGAAEVGEDHGRHRHPRADAEPVQVAEVRGLGIAGGSHHPVALVEQEPRQIGAVLTGDATN